MRKLRINILLSVLGLILTINHLNAQNDVSIHLLQSVPQSIYTNPSFSPQAKVYVGLPMLSSFYFGISHSGFAYRDVVKRRPDDTLYFDLDNMLDKMGSKNFLSANFNERKKIR